jgi:SAM-dependent methyltransferase
MEELWDGEMGQLLCEQMSESNRETEEEAAAELDPAPDATVLVTGFGPGVGIVLLAPRVRQIVGIDPSGVMMREAATRTAGFDNVELRQLEAHELDDIAAFDAAIAVNNAHLWDPFDESVAAIARALKPGARFVTYTHDWAIKRTTDLEVEPWVDLATEVCGRHGLLDVRWWRAQAEEGRSIALCATRAVSRCDR